MIDIWKFPNFGWYAMQVRSKAPRSLWGGRRVFQHSRACRNSVFTLRPNKSAGWSLDSTEKPKRPSSAGRRLPKASRMEPIHFSATFAGVTTSPEWKYFDFGQNLGLSLKLHQKSQKSGGRPVLVALGMSSCFPIEIRRRSGCFDAIRLLRESWEASKRNFAGCKLEISDFP